MSTELPIVSRFLRLRKQVLEPSDVGLTFEGLIDALLVLYEECSNDKTKVRNELVAAFLSKFQTVVHSYNSLRVNIGDFQVKRIIGRGNFGDVKLAKEKMTGNIYALKIMKKVGSQTSAFFSEERDIMARSSSPWLTKLDYAFQDSNFLYLAMEFHCGGDLLNLIERHDNMLDEEFVRFYTAEVALGIHDLHKMGYVHRDIKPENILIDRTGHLKLADFGNAAKLSSSGTVTKSMPVGTPDYIAPEVLQCLQGGHCKSDSHGAQCDYWSLGVLAYEMFYGVTPFNDNDGSVIQTYSNIMMHSSELKFPEERKGSDDLRSLIHMLLQPAEKRLGHLQLLRHPFFSSLDWSNMLNTPPPYVPEVSGIEDDSHFDVIEDESVGVDVSSLKARKEFKNLPFIGFTFTADKDSLKSLEKGEKSIETELKLKVAELDKLKLQNFKLQQQSLNQSKVAENSIREFEQVEKLSTQLSLAEEDNAQLKATIAHIERILEIERQDRVATENKTIQLLTDVKNKWSKAEEERMRVVKSELAEEREKAQSFESKYRESQTELRRQNSELEAVISVKNQLKTKLKDYKQRLENLASIENQRSKKINALESENADLNKTLENVKNQLDESRSVDSKVDTLQLIIDQRDQIVREKDAEIKIRSTEAATFASENRKLTERIQDLEVQLKNKVNEHCKVMTELDGFKSDNAAEKETSYEVQLQLKQEIEDLMKDTKAMEKKYLETEKENEKLKLEVKSRAKELNQANNRIEIQENEFKKELGNKETMYKEKITGLEEVFATLEKRIEDLQGEKENGKQHEAQEVANLEEKVKAMERSQLDLLKEKSEKDCLIEEKRQELDKLTVEYGKLEIELKTFKEGETLMKESAAHISELKAENLKLTQELKEAKLDLRLEKRELEKKSRTLNYVIEKETKLKEKIEELENCKAMLETENNKLHSHEKRNEENIALMKEKDLKYQSKCDEVRKLSNEKSEMTMEIRKLKTDATSVENSKKNLSERIKQLESERDGYQKLDINNKALLEVSKELENQVMDYERLNEKLNVEVQDLKADVREVEANLEREKEETRKAKISVNEEKSGKILMESKLKDLQQRLDETEKVSRAENETHANHLEEYKALCKKLTGTLEDLSKDHASKELVGKQLDRAKTLLEAENLQLKEELAEKTTQLYSHKESNFKLHQGIEEAIEKIEQRNRKVEELEMKLETELRLASEKNLRNEATQAQQTKLIDFLQNKINNMEGRKKTLADKVFGNKENKPVRNHLPVAYADLDSMLEKEKAKNKKLSSQLDRARAEVVALKTNNSEHTPLLKSMIDHLDGATATQRHNIPHRLLSGTCKKVVKCSVCQENVGLFSNASSCKDCGLCIHQACSDLLPNTCGLSSQLAALQINPSITNRPLPPAPSFSAIKEGKVQTLVSGHWTEIYLVLRKEGVLDIYNSSDTSASKRDQLGLILPHCKVSLQSSVAYGEVFNMNSTDRPYIFKISVHNLGKAETAMFIMCQNFASKVDWVNKLEEVIKSSSSNLAPVPDDFDISRQLVCSLPPPEEVLTVEAVDDILVVGTSQGLATVKDGILENCDGISTPVHKVHFLKSLNLLVMVTGGDGLPSNLVMVDARPILSASGSLQPESVCELTSCHIFDCTETSGGKVFLCAANDHLVVMLEWSHKRGHFVLRNKFSTDQHTRTIYFTDHTVLVGTSKFYEIDLITFAAEEFLDLSYPSTQKVVSNFDANDGLPKSVMEMNTSPGEKHYAVAFTRHVLFVDSHGQEVLAPIEFEKLPIEHRLHGGILATTFCDGILFTQIDKEGNHKRMFFSSSTPHLVFEKSDKDLLYSCQDTASNNLMLINVDDLCLSF